jgi:hypothetical protein
VSAHRPPLLRTMRPPRPAGFGFLGFCALLCALAMAAALTIAGVAPPARFALGATGALALVTAEALAFTRPWAFGASLAFAGSFVAMVFVAVHDVAVAMAIAATALLPILVALSIIHNGVGIPPGTAQGNPRRRGLP